MKKLNYEELEDVNGGAAGAKGPFPVDQMTGG